MRLNARRPSAAIVWWSWWMSWSEGWKTTSGCQSFQSSISSSRISWRCSGKVRTSKSWTVRFAAGMPSSAVAAATSCRERVGREALRQRARGDREGDVAHLGALLDEARHRAAAAELAVVGVRREHERALPAPDHCAALRLTARRDRRQREQPPRRAGPRSARCRRGCARRSRARLDRRRDGRGRVGVAAAVAAERQRRSRRRGARRGARGPAMPVSAATVIGASCDAAPGLAVRLSLA